LDTFDLKKCLGCVEQASIQKFGRIPNFEELELIFKGVKNTDRSLSYSMIRMLTRRKYWDFKDHWMVPDWRNLIKRLKKTKGIFKDLPAKEKNAIAILYDIFKNIEVVSIILRFVDPHNYGIISPPVRYALKQFPSENYINEYFNYLSALRSYAKEYKFDRVADADMALWALVENCVILKKSTCVNLKKYQEKIVEVEAEILNANQHYKKMQDELLSIVAQEELSIESEKEKLKKERDKHREKYEDLIKKRSMMIDLIELTKSNVAPEEKIIHDKRGPYIDQGHEYFMKKLAVNDYVHRIIWSENISSKPPTRIANIEENGEVKILYVIKNNYAAKVKVNPYDCPDITHARYFANIIADYMEIPNWS